MYISGILSTCVCGSLVRGRSVARGLLCAGAVKFCLFVCLPFAPHGCRVVSARGATLLLCAGAVPFGLFGSRAGHKSGVNIEAKLTLQRN